MSNRKHTVDVDLIARKRVDRNQQGTRGRQTISEFAEVPSIDGTDLILIEKANGEYYKTTRLVLSGGGPERVDDGGAGINLLAYSEVNTISASARSATI